jgi:hypothetical protein
MTLRTHTRRHARRATAAILSLLVLAGALTVALVGPATGAPGDELLPDLVAEPVGDADTTATTYSVGGDDRLLLRFTSYIRNVGAGPLEVIGENPVAERISGSNVRQVLTHNHDTDGVVGPDKSEVALPGAELKYEESDGHDHWHFQRAARYSLWNEAKNQELDASQKVGFCFLDIQAGDPNYVGPPDSFPINFTPDPQAFPSSTNNCLASMPEFPTAEQPLKTKVDMGISRGWRDIYERTLPFQYIDVSTMAPGHYWLRSEVDPFNLLVESDTMGPNATFATQRSTVPGRVAQGFSAGSINGVNPATSKITLKNTAYQSSVAGTPALGAAMYKIVDGPDHGTLVTGPKDSGGWFSTAQITYQKNGTYNGPDTFEYVAKQAGPAGQFPLNPASASVTMQVGNGSGDTAIGITGAPSWLYTSQGQQLTATVTPDDGVPATWRVDDVPGGNATVGTIDSKGFYKAPATVPAGGTVRITAHSADGAFDAKEVTIVKRPPVTPKPDLPNPPVPPPVNPDNPAKPAPALSKPVVARMGRRVVVKLMPGRTGKLSVVLSRKGKRLATCSVGAVRGRGATCRFTLKKSKVKKLKGTISVYATLKVRGKTVGKQRSTVSLKVSASSARIGPLCILTPVKR